MTSIQDRLQRSDFGAPAVVFISNLLFELTFLAGFPLSFAQVLLLDCFGTFLQNLIDSDMKCEP